MIDILPDEILIKWNIDDVKELRPDLTDQECREVLHKVEHYYDADIGISYFTINYWADELFGEEND